MSEDSVPLTVTDEDGEEHVIGHVTDFSVSSFDEDKDADAIPVEQLKELLGFWREYGHNCMDTESRLIHGYGRSALTCAEELEYLINSTTDTDQ